MDTLTYFYLTVGLMLASGGLGYYAGGRKLAGIKIDLDNTKAEIEKVKNFVSSKTIPQAVTVVTPVAGSKTTNPGTAFASPGI